MISVHSFSKHETELNVPEPNQIQASTSRHLRTRSSFLLPALVAKSAQTVDSTMFSRIEVRFAHFVPNCGADTPDSFGANSSHSDGGLWSQTLVPDCGFVKSLLLVETSDVSPQQRDLTF